MNIDFFCNSIQYAMYIFSYSDTKKIKHTYRSKRRSSSFIMLFLTFSGAKQSSSV